MFSFTRFRVMGLTSKSLIHFVLFLYSVRDTGQIVIVCLWIVSSPFITATKWTLATVPDLQKDRDERVGKGSLLRKLSVRKQGAQEIASHMFPLQHTPMSGVAEEFKGSHLKVS